MGFYFLSQATCAALLVISAVAKLRAPEATRSAFEALRVPRWVPRDISAAGLPWAELVIAIAVAILPPGKGLEYAATALLGLFLCYTTLIARALTFDEPVQCGCFGQLGNDNISAATLVRNIGLVTLAVVILVGPAVPQRWSNPWIWAATGALCAVVAMLSLWHNGTSRSAAAATSSSWLARARLIQLRSHREIALRDVIGNQSATLLFVLPGCAGCERVVAELDDADDSQIIVIGPTGAGADAKYAQLEHFYEDPGFNIATALGVEVIPALLAVDSRGKPVGDLVAGVDNVLAALPRQAEHVAASDVPDRAEIVSDETADYAEDLPDNQRLNTDGHEELADYIRVPIPEGIVINRSGKPQTLHEIASAKAQLLVGVNCLCLSSAEAIAAIPSWQERLGILDVRLIAPFEIGDRAGSREVRQKFLYDHAGIASTALGLQGQASAVLLGADGLLAGGPVYGIEEVRDFVTEIEEQLNSGG